MTDAERTYVVNLANEARRSCEEQKIFEVNKVKLTKDDVSKVINFFGGELKVSETNIQYFEKTGEESFVIYYIPNDSDNIKATTVLAILNGFGKFFIQLESMEIGDIRIYSENGYAISEGESSKDSQMANYFALEFMMPEEIFKQIFIHNIKDEEVDLDLIAEEFGINKTYVQNKAQELNLLNGISYIKKI